MKFNELTTTAHKKPTRVGRGIAAGKGKTAGRGTKGQNARKSGGVRPGFEGGQSPLTQRMPKLRGFTSKRTPTENVYTGQLNELSGKVDNFTLFEAGMISSPYAPTKLIFGRGNVTKKVAVSLQGASTSASEDIQKAGGTFTKVARLQQQKTSKSEKKTK